MKDPGAPSLDKIDRQNSERFWKRWTESQKQKDWHKKLRTVRNYAETWGYDLYLYGGDK